MTNKIPPCAQPDSDCAEEVRKGNPPPCKVRAKEREELIEKIAELLIDNRFHHNEYTDWYKIASSFTEDNQSLFPQYVPIEVEMLTKEEIIIAVCGDCPFEGRFNDEDCHACQRQLEGVSRATVDNINKLTGGKQLYKEVG